MRTIRTQVLFCALALAAGFHSTAQSLAPRAAPEAPRVVFVCEHGSVKSLIAASYFNQRAREKGLSVRAIARGVDPEPTVPLPVRDGLRAAGFDVSTYRPRLLAQADIDGANLVVSFDEDISDTVVGRARHLKWDNLPAVLSDYAAGKNAIVKQVDRLVYELTGERQP